MNLQNKIKDSKYFKLALLVLAGFFLRITLASFGTLFLDQNTYIAWSVNLATSGFLRFYDSWSDYLPGYLYVLWALGKIHLLWPAIPSELLYKLPAILADLATGVLIYKIVLPKKGKFWAQLAFVMYVFNPAILANSTLWGQVDSFTALFSLLVVYTAQQTPWLSGVFLALGFLIKPQVALVAPVVLLVALKNKWKLSDYWFFSLLAIFAIVVLFLPFAGNRQLIVFIWSRIQQTLNQYPYTSVNAFSVWAFGGMWKSDSLATTIIGYLVIVAVAAIGFWRQFKKPQGHYLLMALVFVVAFMFQTRMHERHLLPSLAPLLLAAVFYNDLFIAYFLLSLTYLLNLRYAFVWITDNFRDIFSLDQIKLLVAVNLGSLAMLISHVMGHSTHWIELLVARLQNGLKLKINKHQYFRKDTFPKVPISTKALKLAFLAVVLFATATRLFNLGNPPEMYFDEVYHAFTAKLVLHGDPKAWEWWNPHPEGFAYEWTHPPMAKLGMALGMQLLGEQAIGWRSVQALLGVGCVIMVYLLAQKLFNDSLLSLLASWVFALDGLVMVMSRIGMNDTYLLFFMLLSLWLFFKDRFFTSAFFLGLAIASKWSAVYSLPIYGLYFLLYKRKIVWGHLWFLVIPLAVYVASYWQLFTTGHAWDIFVGVQKQMWWYHTNLKATHAYSSLWWTWPLDYRPVYMYTSQEINGWVGRIYNLGNPLVFWSGLLAILSLTVSFWKHSKNLGLVLFSYFIFFVPWALSPRIMFFYHYLPSIPFLSIALAYILRKHPKLVVTFSIAALLSFVYFYPHWIGLPVPLWLDKSYYWFTFWR